jgi:hypothetical protein
MGSSDHDVPTDTVAELLVMDRRAGSARVGERGRNLVCRALPCLAGADLGEPSLQGMLDTDATQLVSMVVNLVGDRRQGILSELPTFGGVCGDLL